MQPCSFALACVQILLDLRQLHSRVDRAKVGVLVERVTHADAGHADGELGGDFFEDEIGNVERRPRAATPQAPHGHTADREKQRQQTAQEYQKFPDPAERLSGMQRMLPSQYPLSNTVRTRIEHLDHPA